MMIAGDRGHEMMRSGYACARDEMSHPLEEVRGAAELEGE